MSKKPFAIEKQGKVFAELMLEPAEWIHRRVETISYNATGETRRTISFDFSLPSTFPLTSDRKSAVVPLFFLRKGTISHLDFKDGSGTSVSMLDRKLNSQWATAALLSILGGLFQLEDDDQYVIYEILFESREKSRMLADEFVEELKSRVTHLSPTQELFLNFVKSFCDKFILVALLPVNKISTNNILKFSYEEGLPDSEFWWASLKKAKLLEIALGDIGGAYSFHLEVRPPNGVSATSLNILRTDPDQFEVYQDVPQSGPIAHVNLHNAHYWGNYESSVIFKPEQRGLANFGFLGSLSALLFFLTVYLLLIFDPTIVTHLQSGSRLHNLISAFLVVPGIFFAILSRPLEHRLTSFVFFPVRFINFSTALLLVFFALLVQIAEARIIYLFYTGILIILQAILFYYSIDA